jgi:Fur family transcriptional regulator, ferric uptake regulator
MDTVPDTIRAAGLRCTPARVRVLTAILDLHRPVTHAQLAEHADLEGLDDITLYRTLATLEEVGLTHRVHGTDGVWRTCAQPKDQPGCPGNHAHFLCGDCGAMQCLVDQPMPRVKVPRGARVEGRHFVVFGSCAACARASHSGVRR